MKYINKCKYVIPLTVFISLLGCIAIHNMYLDIMTYP